MIPRSALGIFGVVCVLGCAGGQSNSEVAGGGGASGASGTGGASGGSTGACPARSEIVLGVRVVMEVSWASTLGAQAGSGRIQLWNRVALHASGAALSGSVRPCGTLLPPSEMPAPLSGTLLVEMPDAIWDSARMPSFPASGTLGGWRLGDALRVSPTVALLGGTLADPTGNWPQTANDPALMAVDVDGDVQGGDPAPGFTALPRDDAAHILPPVGIDLLGARADRLDLVSRTVVELEGTFAECDAPAGTARVTRLDSHVVGCHVFGGDDCNQRQVDFIDQNRPIYQVASGSFAAVPLDGNADCTAVRSALPP